MIGKKKWKKRNQTSDDDHRPISFDLVGDGALSIYVHNTKQDVNNLNKLMIDQVNLLTSTGSFAVKFIELNQNLPSQVYQKLKL